MFVNCPHCRALVATDPATDLPPPTCPDCRGPLRDQASGDTSADDARRAHADPTLVRVDARPDTAVPAPQRDSWWEEAAARTHSRHRLDPDEQHQAATGDSAQVAEAPEEAPDTQDAPTSTPPAADASADRAPAAGLMAAAVPSRGALPGFLRRRERTGARSGWRAPAVIVGLSLLLGLQVLLADRARLAGHAGWRPLLSALCAGLGCELPPWREPAAFTLLQRDVRQHPSLPGALRVSASFRNDARWPQPWPRLQVALADANGRPAGIRNFDATEYLGGAPAQTELASGETATVAMDILEPAPDIVSFDFSFR